MYELPPTSLADKLARFDVECTDLAPLVELEEALKAAANVEAPPSIAKAIDADELTVKNTQEVFDAEVRFVVDKEIRQRTYGAAIQRLSRKAKRVLRANADDVIEALRPEFDATVAAMAEDVAIVGASPDKSVLQLSPKAANAYHSLQELTLRLRNLHGLRVDLGGQQSADWYLAEVSNLGDIEQARRIYKTDGVPGLIANGYQLHLNTANEIAALVAAAEEATAALEAARRANNPIAQADRKAVEKDHAHHLSRVGQKAKGKK